MPNHSVFGAAWRDIMPIGELSIQHSHECQSGGPPAQIPGKACAGWRLATVRFQTTDRATNRWKIQLFFISSEDPSLQPPLNSDDIMVQVRREFARRYGALAPATETADEVDLPCWQPAVPRLPDKPQYVLGDFLRFDDEDFIDVVYRKLLRRPAEDAGSREYLEALRQGAISKVEILGMIRFSGEGRMHSVHVDGLLLPYKLHRWRRVPVIGWFIGMAMAILRLPRLAWHLQHIEASAARESHELGRLLDRMGTAIEGRLGSAELSSMARMDTIGATIAELQERMAANEAAQKQFLTEIQQRQVGLIEQVAAHGMALTDQGEQIAAHDTALADLGERARRDQRSLRAMLERLTVFLDIALQREKHGKETEGAASPESQYASFEEAFRGDRAQIKRRVEHYLGTLAAAGIEPGEEGLILDLGSGRGEWLEVLAGHGYHGCGVDLDRGMLKESEARGHEVVEADALDYLRTRDNDSIAAITSMHLVEHIPHSILIKLLDEALRVLRPGGVLILETPNPENVLVGSCMFYLDPTHLRPIPPMLLQWIVQARGFEQAAIERLSEHRGPPSLLPVSDNVPGATQINRMIEWFTAPPDYAVIARKPMTRLFAAD